MINCLVQMRSEIAVRVQILWGVHCENLEFYHINQIPVSDHDFSRQQNQKQWETAAQDKPKLLVNCRGTLV